MNGDPIITLSEEDRLKLDDIVSQMTANNESEEDIQFVVDDFKSKYGKKKDGTELSSPTDSLDSQSDPFRSEVERKYSEKSDAWLAFNSLGNAFQNLGNGTALLLNEISQFTNPLTAGKKWQSLLTDDPKEAERLRAEADPLGISKKLMEWMDTNEKQSDANKIAMLWEDGKTYEQAVEEANQGIIKTFNEQGTVDGWEKIGYETMMQVPNILLAMATGGVGSAARAGAVNVAKRGVQAAVTSGARRKGAQKALDAAVKAQQASSKNLTAAAFGGQEFSRSLSSEYAQDGSISGTDYLESLARAGVEGIGTRLFGGIDAKMAQVFTKGVTKEVAKGQMKKGILQASKSIFGTGIGEAFEEGSIEMGAYMLDTAFDGVEWNSDVAAERFLDAALLGSLMGGGTSATIEAVSYSRAKTADSEEIKAIEKEEAMESTTEEKAKYLSKRKEDLLKRIGIKNVEANMTEEDVNDLRNIMVEEKTLEDIIPTVADPKIKKQLEQELEEIKGERREIIRRAEGEKVLEQSQETKTLLEKRKEMDKKVDEAFNEYGEESEEYKAVVVESEKLNDQIKIAQKEDSKPVPVIKSRAVKNVRSKKVAIDAGENGSFVNIGMVRGMDGDAITEEEITEALPEDVTIEQSSVVTENVDEPTMAMKLSRELTGREMTQMRETLDKIAIPQLSKGAGAMYRGEETAKEDWGSFNPDYFIMPDGSVLSSKVEEYQKGVEFRTIKKAEGIEDLKGIMVEKFNMTNKQADAASRVTDLMIETMAQREGVTKEAMYSTLSFGGDIDLNQVQEQGTTLFQLQEEAVPALESPAVEMKSKLAKGTSLKVGGNEPVVGSKVSINTKVKKPTEGELKKGITDLQIENFEGFDSFVSTMNESPTSKWMSIARLLSQGAVEYSLKDKETKEIKKYRYEIPFSDPELVKFIDRKRKQYKKLSNKTADKIKKAKIKKELNSKIAEFYMSYRDNLTDTILGLYDSIDPDFRDVSMKWYEGANRFANKLAKDYNLSLEQVGGILGVLSPQKDWFTNVSNAERTIDIMSNHINNKITSGQIDEAYKKFNKSAKKGKEVKSAEALRELKPKIEGKSINDLLSEGFEHKTIAIALRAIDQTINSPSVLATTPEGTNIGYTTGSVAWNSFAEIGRAISLFLDGSERNISNTIGEGNKVRSFVNNIINPFSEAKEVTADTHAASVAFGVPTSANNAQNALNLFDGGTSPMYAIVEDAYRKAAEMRGIKYPRALQSVTWEAQRVSVNNADRSAEFKQEVFRFAKELEESNATPYERAVKIATKYQGKTPDWAIQRGIRNVKRELSEVLQGDKPKTNKGVGSLYVSGGQLRGGDIGGASTELDRGTLGSTESQVLMQEDVESPSSTAKGAMFAKDGRAIISAYENADVSTFMHEMAHVYEHYLDNKERSTILEWAGKSSWDVETSEKFARGFEKYLAEGTAPNYSLAKIFKKFSKWLGKIYNDITDSSIDIEISPEVRAIYDSMITPKVDSPSGVLASTAKTLTKRLNESREAGTEEVKPMSEAPLQTETGEKIRRAGKAVSKVERKLVDNPLTRGISKAMTVFKMAQHNIDKPLSKVIKGGVSIASKAGKKVGGLLSSAENKLWDSIAEFTGKQAEHSFSVTNSLINVMEAFAGTAAQSASYRENRKKKEGREASDHLLTNELVSLLVSLQERMTDQDVTKVWMALDSEASLNNLTSAELLSEELLSSIDEVNQAADSVYQESLNETKDKKKAEEARDSFLKEAMNERYAAIAEEVSSGFTYDQGLLFDTLRGLNDYIHELNYAKGFIPLETYQAMKGKYIARQYEEIEFAKVESDYKNGLIDKSIYKARKDLNKHMSSVTDPISLTVDRLSKTLQNVAVQDYIDTIEKDPSNHLTEEQWENLPQTEKGAYTKLSGFKKTGLFGGVDRVGKFGKLEGKYVKNQYVRDLTESEFLGETFGTLHKLLDKYDKSWWRQMTKQGLTTLNPATRLVNIISGYHFANIIGVDGMSFTLRKQDAKDEFNNGGEMFLFLLKKGLFGKANINQEFLTKDIRSLQITEETNFLSGYDKLDKGIKTIQDVTQIAKESYGRADDIAKLSAFISLVRDQGVDMDTAAERVRKGMQDYSTVGRAYSLGAKIPVIGKTFVRFQADLLRITANGFTEKPLTTSMYIGSIYAMYRLLSSLSGEDEKEREFRARRTFTPKMDVPFLGQIPLMWKVGDYEVNMAKYVTPWYQYDIGSVGDGTFDPKFSPISIYFKDGMPKVKSSDPTLGWVWDVFVSGKDFRGKDIRNPDNNPLLESEENANAMWYAARNSIGNVLPIKLAHDIYLSSKDGLDYYDRHRTWDETVMSRIIKIEEWDDSRLKEEIEKQAYFKGKEIRDLNAERKQLKYWYKKEAKKIYSRFEGNDSKIKSKMDDLNSSYINKKQGIEKEMAEKMNSFSDWKSMTKGIR